MRPIVSAGVLLTVCDALCGCWPFQSASGLVAIDQSYKAVRQATSWHMEGRATSPNGDRRGTFVHDVVCPHDYQQSDVWHDAQGREHTERMAMVGHDFYSWTTDHWLTNKGGAPPEGPPDCTMGPLLPWRTNLFGDSGEVLRNAIVTARSVVGSGDAACQSWEIAYETPAGVTPRYSTCINEADHLPRRVTFPNDTADYVFSQWNHARVTPPEGAAQQ